MKLSNGQIYVAGPAVRKLMGQKVPVSSSARIVRLAQELDIHLAVIEGVRQQLIKQYGKEVDGDIKILPNTPEMESFSKDWAELLVEEVEVKFEGGKLKLPWTVEIDPQSLLALDAFVEIPTE